MAENGGAWLDLRWQALILLLAIGGVIYLLSPVLMPFVVAALFAYLLDPVVDRLEPRIGRNLAVSLVFLVATVLVVAVMLVLVPFIERQISNFLAQLPVWLNWFQTRATPWLEARFGISPDILDTQKIFETLQAHWKEAGGIAATVVAKVSKSGMALVGWVLNLVMIPVVAFYLLRDWDVLVARIHSLIPRSIEPVVSRLSRESDDVLGAFLRGQLSVMVALGVFYGVGLWLVGINVGPLIGMIAGLISFVPYLGAITGVLMGVIAALVQYQDWFHVALVLGVFVIGQTLEGYVLVPKLVGDKIGLHPVAVIFAVLAGGELFGFLGVLLALPVASVVMVLLRYLYERYTQSELYTTRAHPEIIVPGAESVVVVAADSVVVEGAPPRPSEPPGNA
ncbi:AI-2E family transporter [Dokdonella sp.]|uniref:AI-2E family transporter n=1 Tax=Dokdonella sp. TaxID=2291710 RepID=UPI001B10ECA6|nr:AI-2E family transporter [Dokdonella sp.]MBO9663236.1 AI-2E family transporter [Dokdonella sp.]